MANEIRCLRDRIIAGLRHYDGTAVVCGQNRFSYADVDAASDRLALRMAARLSELQAECPVAFPIVADRSVEFIVALLACWKLGCGYVPLSRDTPERRIELVLRDVGAPFAVVASEAPLSHCPALNWVLDASPCDTRPSRLRDDGLAYVIYTSGTSGTPKGCIIGFESLTPIIDAFIDHFSISSASRVTFVANVAFDAAVIEIFPALACGAEIHVVRQHVLLDPQRLAAFYRDYEISFSWLPTPVAEVLMLEPDLDLPECLQTIETAGQRLTVRPPARWKTRVENSYGPTEATVISTSGVVQADAEGLPDIGAPLPGVRCFIVGPDRVLVNDGEIGELLIAGVGLSRGYLNRPELDAERFLLVEDGEGKRCRAYASGDLCRRSADGKLQFVGRVDNQLKINGVRIEPSEIEGALGGLDGIGQVHVAARTLGSNRVLVAYFTLRAGVRVDVARMREYLLERLPRYMVPERYVELQHFPLTERGKIDESALPEPSVVSGPVEAELDPSQQLFLDAFERVLGIRVGWNEDFFAAGGNSIGAIRLAAEVRRTLALSLPYEAVETERTPAAMFAACAAGIEIHEIRHRAPSMEAPLSSSQRSVWFMVDQNPLDRAYLAKSMIRLRGSINAVALQAALQDVVDRHEIYRTGFPSADGEGRQRIAARCSVSLECFDLRDSAPQAVESDLRDLLDGPLGGPFDLDAPPLVRWGLAAMPGDEHVLLMVEHHLVHDGWSFNLFLEDFCDFYRARCAGRKLRLAPPFQYGDFCVSQQEWLRSEAADSARAFWRRQLHEVPLKINLPRQAITGPVAPRGKTLRVELERDSWRRIELLAASRGETAFSVVFAAFAMTLARFSGDHDICVGSAFANRGWGNATDIIGMMINTVALRLRLADEKSTDELMRDAFRAVSEAQRYQALPFEEIVKAAGPRREPGVNPLFQVFLGFHDSPMPTLDLPGVHETTVIEAIDSEAAKFDLSVVVIPRRGQLGTDDPVHVLWEFRCDLMPEWLVRGMVEQFRESLLQLAAPNHVWSTVAPAAGSLLQGPIAPAGATTLIEAVIQAAERSPEAAAVRHRGLDVTYRDLVNEVLRKAGALAAAGVGRGDRVGICVERGHHLVAWLLAVHVVGAAYVPLDPSYPLARRRYVVEHARLVALVGGEEGTDACIAIAADAHGQPWPGPPVADMDGAAYVIYTSGSTGKPKGVMVSQRAVMHFMDAMGDWFPLQPSDRWLAATSCAFDISVLELLYPLTCGATVVVADREDVRDSTRLTAMLDEEGITHFQATPSGWRTLMQESWQPLRPLAGLCGGEALDCALADEILARGIRLYNLYGPTETTVWATVAHVSPDRRSAPPPLGHPLRNSRVALVDPSGSIVPRGAVGELWIGGDGLADGYLFEPALTAERFVARAGEDTVWYRTGDLASLDEKGDLVFHGRNDYQVKVHGYRVELGEIEVAMAEQPGVDVAVAVVQSIAATARLAALYCGSEAAPSPVTQRCADRLPAHMVPHVVERLMTLPLTPNGKIDRVTLGSMQVAAPKAAVTRDLTDSEQIVGALYERHLGSTGVDPDVGFFELGGHSLMAMRIAKQLSIAFDVHVRTADVLALGSVRRVAAFVDSLRPVRFEGGDFVEEIAL